jgi:septal ring factor EnvC (AmiA/AmiB activator)
MMMADDTFNKVMKGLKSTKGLTKAQQAELDKRRAKGEAQAANDRKRRATQKKAKDRHRGNDGVIDTGMFGS